jgi:hypothetical protein
MQTFAKRREGEVDDDDALEDDDEALLDDEDDLDELTSESWTKAKA